MVEVVVVGSASSVRALLARMSRRSVGWLGVAVIFGAGTRLYLVAAAWLAVRGAHERNALLLAIGGALLFGALRGVQALVRVRVQRDVYAATAHAALASDVLAVPNGDLRQVALDGSYYAVSLVAELLPALLADIVASLVLVPFAAMNLEPRLLATGAVAILAVTLVASLLRSMARRLEEAAAFAYAAVIEGLLAAIDGRLEIVARAAESEIEARFARTLAVHATTTRRSAGRRALLGRAPMIAGALAIVLAFAAHAPPRSLFEGALLTHAVLLGAVVPVFHGAALGLHGMLRALVFVGPLVDLMTTEARQGDDAGERIELPVPIVGRGVSFAYEDGGASILDGVDFAWQPGEPLVLRGPNGAGKSTLLKVLLRLRRTKTGVITYGETSLDAIAVRHLRRQVAYLPQRPYLGEAHGTVRDGLRFFDRSAGDTALRAALERVGFIATLRDKDRDPLELSVGELSAGQRQRAALARVLLADARMVMLDEPDANLDAGGIALVVGLVRELCAEGVMVAVAAHTPELASMSARPVDLGRQR